MRSIDLLSAAGEGGSEALSTIVIGIFTLAATIGIMFLIARR